MREKTETIVGRKPTVLTYYTYSNRIGGPLTYINTLKKSELCRDYNIQSLFQEKAPGGLDISLFISMVKAIKKIKPEIVHVQGAQSEGFYGVLAAKAAGCRNVVLTIHGFAFDDAGCRGIKKLLYKYLVEPITIRLADRVFCVCAYAAGRRIVRWNAGKGRRNCGYIHNCIPKMEVSKSREQMRGQLVISMEESVFCVCGRLSREKGLDILADAWLKLKTFGVNQPRLLIIGDGEYRSEFETLLQADIASGQVIMVGQTDRVADYLNASDVFVFPSYHENLSIALLEACASGLACIVSDVGGNTEIITDGVNGIVVQEQTGMAYANAMAALLEDPDRMKLYQKTGRTLVYERFSRENMIEEVRKVYDSCGKANGFFVS